MALAKIVKVCYMYGTLDEAKMRSAAMTERFLQNIWLTVIARLTILAAPFVVSGVTWLTVEMYRGVQATLELQRNQIIEIQRELQDHEFRLGAGKTARLEFQAAAAQQMTRLDTQLDEIAAKITSVNDTVIRVQTIIETRLPVREGSLQWPRQ